MNPLEAPTTTVPDVSQDGSPGVPEPTAETTADTPAAPARARRRPIVVATGSAQLVAEVATRPDGRPDEELVLQALEAADGSPLLRFGYRRAGRMLRGPASATPAEVTALLAAVRDDPTFAPFAAGEVGD